MNNTSTASSFFPHTEQCVGNFSTTISFSSLDHLLSPPSTLLLTIFRNDFHRKPVYHHQERWRRNAHSTAGARVSLHSRRRRTACTQKSASGMSERHRGPPPSVHASSLARRKTHGLLTIRSDHEDVSTAEVLNPHLCPMLPLTRRPGRHAPSHVRSASEQRNVLPLAAESNRQYTLCYLAHDALCFPQKSFAVWVASHRDPNG